VSVNISNPLLKFLQCMNFINFTASATSFCLFCLKEKTSEYRWFSLVRFETVFWVKEDKVNFNNVWMNEQMD